MIVEPIKLIYHFERTMKSTYFLFTGKPSGQVLNQVIFVNQ
jgi:hypothetical protein